MLSPHHTYFIILTFLTSYNIMLLCASCPVSDPFQALIYVLLRCFTFFIFNLVDFFLSSCHRSHNDADCYARIWSLLCCNIVEWCDMKLIHEIFFFFIFPSSLDVRYKFNWILIQSMQFFIIHSMKIAMAQ